MRAADRPSALGLRQLPESPQAGGVRLVRGLHARSVDVAPPATDGPATELVIAIQDDEERDYLLEELGLDLFRREFIDKIVEPYERKWLRVGQGSRGKGCGKAVFLRCPNALAITSPETRADNLVVPVGGGTWGLDCRGGIQDHRPLEALERGRGVSLLAAPRHRLRTAKEGHGGLDLGALPGSANTGAGRLTGDGLRR